MDKIYEQLSRFAVTEKDRQLRDMTTLRIGGKVRYTVYPDSVTALDSVMNYIEDKGLPFKLIGKGSDLLCSDSDFDGAVIRFQAPYSLERYTEVKKWDDGYLVVLAKYIHNAEPEEEYIDLKPVLIDKGIDPVTFLKPIKTVRIA